MGEEIKMFSELGINLGTELASKVIDSTIFDLTYKKRSVRDFLKKTIEENGEISEDDVKKVALLLNINKIEKKIKRSCKICLEADKIMCEIGAEKNAKSPSEEWLEYFDELCTKTTSENVQKMWARVLVKEHLEAGSITKVMMNTLAMLDKDSGKAFEKLCSLTYFLECENENCYYIPLILYDDILCKIIKSNNGKKEFENKREVLENYSQYLPTQKEIEYLSELGLLNLSPIHDESEIYSHEQIKLIFQVDKKIYVTESIYNEIDDYYYVPTGQAFFTQTGLALYHALQIEHYPYLYDVLKWYIITSKEQ